MNRIDLSPEALEDLQRLEEYLENEYGKDSAETIVGKVMDSIGNLLQFPDSGVSVFEKYNIICDYLYIVASHNYVFYRKERDVIRVIRVLNEKQDFMYILFGIKSTLQETEDYWKE